MTFKINHRWRLSPGDKSPTEAVSPEPGEAEIRPAEVTDEAMEEVTEEAGEEAKQAKPPEDPGTPQTHQRPVVNATIDMVRKPGFVWPHSPVHGKTSVLHVLSNEDPAGLAKEI